METDYDMDNIKFKNYSGDKLIIELSKMYDYNKIINGYIDAKNWTIITE